VTAASAGVVVSATVAAPFFLLTEKRIWTTRMGDLKARATAGTVAIGCVYIDPHGHQSVQVGGGGLESKVATPSTETEAVGLSAPAMAFWVIRCTSSLHKRQRKRRR